MSDVESLKEDDSIYVPFIPPLTGSEEEVNDAERAQPSESKSKDKGVIQSEVFETQRLINGTKLEPPVGRGWLLTSVRFPKQSTEHVKST